MKVTSERSRYWNEGTRVRYRRSGGVNACAIVVSIPDQVVATRSRAIEVPPSPSVLKGWELWVPKTHNH